MKPADLVHQSLLAGTIDIQLLRDERLHEPFEAAARRAPLAPAMTCAGQSVTYGELEALADRWSRSLRARGIGPGSKVGVWLTRSIALHAAVLAVLKSGATYLPFDDQAPAERVATCLEDCAADLLLVDAGQAGRAAGLPVAAVDVAALDDDVAAAPALRPPASQAAYIIYTSGSTGRPKGVAVSHASICHFVRAENALLDVTAADVVYAGFSAAFDMSLEEVFIAYLAGACLAVATAEQAQQIDRLPDTLTQAGVTVLHCVPTLLALVDRDMPGLRLINLGGEACPQALVERWWRPGLRLTNTYGPTEATVSATLAELRPGTPVTIGRPLPNYTVLIVDEHGRLVPTGAAGELCIGGPGVSLGYVNRPLLTAAAFVPVPGSGDLAYPTMYRTGDRATIDAHGQIHLHGRLDGQVKHRGFRIELGEIEAELTRLPAVRAAAVVLRGSGADEHLAAYVVASGFDQRALRVSLSERLPSYMVPAAFHVLDALPRLPSGKVDRKALPELPHRLDTADADDPLLAVLQSLFPHARAGLQDDFFRDLGGHSLLAAAFVSQVRKLPRFARLSLQDLYELRTAERLSARFATAAPDAALPDFLPVSRAKHALCTLAQAALLPFIFAIASMEFLLPYIALDQTHDDAGWIAAIGLALGVFIAIPPLTMAVAIAAKWLVLGRVRPGRHPLWGSMFLRWWFVSRLQDIVVRTVLADTPLMAAYYRLLGARIGTGAHLGDVGTGAPDLVTIGAGTTIGSRTLLNTATVAGGWLIFGPVSIGADAQIGSACVLEPGSSVGDGGELGSLSCLGAGAAIPAGQLWSGSPAEPRGATPTDTNTDTGPTATRRGWRIPAATAGFALIALLLMPVLHLLPMLPSLAALDMAQEAGPVRRDLILIAPVIALAYTLLVLLEVTVLRWLLLARVSEGEHETVSLFYLRKWTVDRLLDLSLAVLHPIFATLYVVPFFRGLGARVGAGAEISTAASVTHDLLEVGEGAFIADSVKLGDQEIRHGRLRLKRTVIGRRTFVGNSAFVPSGAHLPDDALVGCLSVPSLLQPGQACFGSPAIVLPSRQQSTSYDARLTFRPRRWAVVQRLVIEAVRILLPRGALFVAICFGLDYFDTLPDDLGLPLALLTVPLLYVVLFVAPAVLGVAALKWAVVGRYRPAEYPLWSRQVWLSEAITAIYEGLTVPLCLRHLRGTAFLPMALRLFGARIGRRVWMESTELTEFDLVTIGDEAELNQDGGPQTHLFEDRVMKMDRLVLGARSTMGPYSIALPGAQLQDEARLGALSLVMKGETIPSGPAWTGSPARCQG